MSHNDFDRFVTGNANGLLRTAYLIVWDLPEAEDLLQETLLKVAKRWPRVSRMDHPIAYARRILVNLALAEGPKRSRRQAELREAQRSEPAVPAPVDTHDELYAALAALPPRQRAVVVLRYFLDLSEAEAAAALQCSLGTVKSTTSRGLARLEQTLRPTNDPRSIASCPSSKPTCARCCTNVPRASKHPPTFSPPTTTRARAAWGLRWRSAAALRPPCARSSPC